tara:strand:- start:10530 stop:11027 length:498 start_codon:yes stop_codon:yes gene_type:complete
MEWINTADNPEAEDICTVCKKTYIWKKNDVIKNICIVFLIKICFPIIYTVIIFTMTYFISMHLQHSIYDDPINTLHSKQIALLICSVPLIITSFRFLENGYGTFLVCVLGLLFTIIFTIELWGIAIIYFWTLYITIKLYNKYYKKYIYELEAETYITDNLIDIEV